MSSHIGFSIRSLGRDPASFCRFGSSYQLNQIKLTPLSMFKEKGICFYYACVHDFSFVLTLCLLSFLFDSLSFCSCLLLLLFLVSIYSKNKCLSWNLLSDQVHKIEFTVYFSCLLFQNINHSCHGGHLPCQTLSPEQSQQARHHRALQHTLEFGYVQTRNRCNAWEHLVFWFIMFSRRPAYVEKEGND